MAANGGDCEKVLAKFAKEGINVDSLAAQLAGRDCKIVCEILERIAGGDCIQERLAQAACLTWQLNQQKNYA